MQFKFFCDIILLAVVCVVFSDEEINKDFTKEPEYGIKDFVDNILFEPEMCNATHPCQNGGTCFQNECRYLNDTSGVLGQNLDGCQAKCGKADCVYNVTSKDVDCKCRNGLGFDDSKKMCRYCDCGEYSKSCSYVKGVKKCICWDVYEDKLGICTLCWCKGYSSMNGCHFDHNGNMKCPCLRGYAQLEDECKKCDCGSNGNCTLHGWGYKSCQCEKGYAEYDGTCKECNCGENGTCGFHNGRKVCSCKTGFEEYKGTCKECDCGDLSYCKFDSNGNKECSCYDGYAMNAGVCTACNCNPGKSCIFKGAIEKECICPHGYADIGGMCAVCDCRMDDSNCTLILKSDYRTGIKTCHCPKGYTSDNNFVDPSCIDINECLRPQDNDCPLSTECVNTPGSYKCICSKGYQPLFKHENYDYKKYGCQDIDECEKSFACYSMYARCVNTAGSYRCDCKRGYSVEKSVRGLEKDNKCVEGARPWRTASIVFGTLFGIVIFVLLLAIWVKKDITQ